MGIGEVIADQSKFYEDRAASYLQDLKMVAIHGGLVVGIGYLFGGF